MTAPTVVYIESVQTNSVSTIPNNNATVAAGDLCVITVGGAPAYMLSTAPIYLSGGADAGFSTAFLRHQSANNASQASCFYKVLTSQDATDLASAGTTRVFTGCNGATGTGRTQFWVFRHAHGWDAATCLVAIQFASNPGTAPQTVATMTDVSRPVVAVQMCDVAGPQNALQFTWAGSPNSTARAPYVDESSSTTTSGGHTSHYGSNTGVIQADYQEYDVSDTPGTVTADQGTATNSAIFALAEFQAQAQTVALGTATETDTAVTLGHTKKLTLGVPTETDTAFHIARASNNQTVGLATETDTGIAIRPSRLKSVGLATETDTAVTIRASHRVAAGTATENDTAFSLAPQSTRSITFLLSDPGDHGSATRKLVVYANKTSALQSGTISIQLYDGATLLNTLAATTLTTTDTAYILPITGTITDFTILEAVVTFGSAGALTAQVNDVELIFDNEVGTATETDTAIQIRAGRNKTVGTATDTETAFSVIPSHAHLVGVAVETDTALSVEVPRILGVRAEIHTDSRADVRTLSTASIKE